MGNYVEQLKFSGGAHDTTVFDRMVQSFIAKAIVAKPEQVTPDLARAVLQNAIPILGVQRVEWSPRQLDYAIWKRESSGR